MRRILIVVMGLAGLGGALSACGDEDPTAVGSELIGPSMTTFEVVLDPAEFLAGDTTYDGFGRIQDTNTFRVLANQFAGELDAHTLFRIVRPYTVVYQPVSDGPSQVDSLLAIRGARVTLIVDSVASTPGPVEVEVRPLTESWDYRTVNWTLRSDTGGVATPWSTPGGTALAPVGSATWIRGDTLVIPIDSASAAVWQDTVNARYGALLRTTTPGARLTIRQVSFAFDVVPEEMPDTVLDGGSAPVNMHLVSTGPTTPPPTELRAGGLPAWRTLFQFRALRDLVVDACGSGGLGTGDPQCDVRLGDATLTLAEVLLRPVPVGARILERPVTIGALQILSAPGVPPVRSPISAVGQLVSDTVRPALFTTTPPAGAQVAVPVTGYVRRLMAPADPEAPPSDWLAIISTAERQTFGYAAFASSETATPPRLRLVLTVPNRGIFE